MSDSENERLHARHARLLELVEEQKSGRPIGEGELPAAASSGLGEPSELGEMIGPYRVRHQLGHGGQGVVYLAEDTRLGRVVALKLMSVGGAATEAGHARFAREATAASRLQHPGVCTVYEAGVIDGQRFLAMEMIEGESLSDWIAEHAPTGSVGESSTRHRRVSRAFEIVEQLAQALHATHQAGVVHRDLKPANVMLRRDGSPVVLDFGVARDEHGEGATLTMQGDVLGTPAYMPPERVRGSSGGADPREDVYGLGAILYECLTGRRPFEGLTREQLYRKILTEPVGDPRRHDPAIPREAHFVVETALDKVADRRYASALDLAADIRRLRERRPIRARPVPAWLRFGRWVQRNPQAAVPTIAAFVVLLLGIVVASILFRERGDALEDARVRALIGESNRSLATDVQRALGEARAAYALRQNAATRSQLYEVLARSYELAGWQLAGQAIFAAFAAEGRVVTLHDRCLQIRRSQDGEIVKEVRLSHRVHAARVDHLGRRVAVASADRVVRVFATGDAALLFSLQHETPLAVRRAAGESHEVLVEFSPADPELLLTGAQGGACLWRLRGQQAECLWRDPGPSARICHVAFAADGAHFATGETNGAVRVFGVVDGALRGSWQAHPGGVRTISFDPRRPLLVSGGDGGGVGVWSLDGAPLGKLSTFGRATLHVSFSPATRALFDSWLVATDSNRAVHLWRTSGATGFELVQHITEHSGDVLMTAFSPDGGRLLTASRDGTALLRDVEGETILRYRAGRGPVRMAGFSPDGQRVITVSNDGTARIWNTSNPEFRVLRHDAAVLNVTASKRHVVALLRSGAAVVHELATGARHVLDTGFTEMSWPAAISPDGRCLVLGGAEGRVRGWDLLSEPPARLDLDLDFERRVASVAFDPGGGPGILIGHQGGVVLVGPGGAAEQVAKGRFGLTAWVAGDQFIGIGNGNFFWDLRRNEQGKHPGFVVKALTVSPDRRWLATSGAAGQVWLFRVETRELVHELPRHGGECYGLAFSPDSKRLVSGSKDMTARIWDVQTGAHLATLRGHEGGVIGCDVSLDGKRIITSSTDGTLRFWPADFADLERLAAQRTVR